MQNLHSCFYEGRLIHRRHQPVGNTFRYRVMMILLDLAEAPNLFGAAGMLSSFGLWSSRWPALAWYRRNDYYGEPRIPLDQSIRQLVRERLGFSPSGPVRLLTNLRLWGWRMNPVSFYYCYDEQDTALQALVAEVRNTPWNETHCYVIDLRREPYQRAAYRFETAKAMHVSPFLPPELTYRWSVSLPAQDLSLRISASKRNDAALLDACLQLRRKPITEASKIEYLCKYPWQTARVWLRIYWQAFRLWRKAAPVYSHPEQNPSVA